MDILEKLYRSPLGKAAARKAGLADPPVLRRGRAMPSGPVAFASLQSGTLGAQTLEMLGIPVIEPVLDLPENRSKDAEGRGLAPTYPTQIGALVVDLTGVREIAQLEEVRQVLRPAMRGLEKSGRVVLLATDAAAVDGLEAKAVAQAIDGINRTVAKELRGGATSNLVFVRTGTQPEHLASTLSFLLQGRSAFVDGQAWRVGPSKTSHAPSEQPFAGRIVVVTGAARGIGAAIANVFARDGATVVGVDVPAAGESLAAVANQVRGSALQVDITAPDAGERIAAHVASVHGPSARIWAMVHNAGITRDKMLANLDETRWAFVLQVNLAAEIRINALLLANPESPGTLDLGGRIVGIASTSGVAGNRGQTNYAASKAGVMGLVWAMAQQYADAEFTTNAVAPGFIETEMTAAIPFVQREIFRRTNSLSQAGQPADVAELIAYFCDPASGGVNGQVVRVCGQNLVGA